MKVAKLKAELSALNDNDEVFMAFPSGDYWGTTIVRKVDDVSMEKVAWSDYHNCHKLIDPEKEDNYEADELKEVIIIS